MPEIENTEVKVTKKKKRKKIKTKIVCIIFIVIAIAIFTNVGKQVYQMLQLKKKKELVETQLKEYQDEYDALVTVKTKLSDPNYVTTYARGEYMFSKGDEKLFYLPAAEDETQKEAEVEEKQEEQQEQQEEQQEETPAENQ